MDIFGETGFQTIATVLQWYSKYKKDKGERKNGAYRASGASAGTLSPGRTGFF
jgi:hypothetical protein